MVQRRNTAPQNNSAIEEISKQMDLPKVFVELLFTRGLDTQDKINEFLNPETVGFFDPFLMKGMDRAANRILSAFKNDERILIYSDYDADGICSSAILSLYFSKFSSEVYVHIPGRNEDGYGLNITTLERIIDDKNPDLIVTCDCGISCVNEVEYILDLGLDVIVTDHHSAPEIIPDCTIVNPHQVGCEYPFKDLCGAGVAFKLIQAISRLKGDSDAELEEYLDLAAVATVADLVNLLSENRLIVAKGLKQLQRGGNLGLTRLLHLLGLEEVQASDIAFKIAPRINAAGRMGDASRAFDLVTLRDITKVDSLLMEIERDNEERRRLCDHIYSQAIAELHKQKLNSKKAVVLHGKDWEKGVTGIVAARLGSELKRPCVLIAGSGDSCKGTARSIEGVNIYDIISSLQHLLTEFGGHAQAAGFSIDDKNIEEFKACFEEIASAIDDSLFLPRFYYDCEITEQEINKPLLKSLKLLEPTGHSNYKPMFLLSSKEFKTAPCKNNPCHTQITSKEGFVTFAFHNDSITSLLKGAFNKNLVIELKDSNYGPFYASGIMRHVETEGLFIDDELARAAFIRLVNFKQSEEEIDVNHFKNLIEILKEGIFGTILIAGSQKTFDFAMQSSVKHAIIICEAYKCRAKNNYNRLVISPDISTLPLELYDRIVFLDSPPTTACLRVIKKRTNAQIFVPADNNFADILQGVSFEREIFGNCFALLKAAPLAAPSLSAYFDLISSASTGINKVQLMVCLSVFVDLGLMSINTGSIGDLLIKFHPEVKTKLEDSNIYNQLKEYHNQ